MDLEQTTAWISDKRFAPFLERAGDDRALAIQLYLWHAQIAGASLTTLHHFEVTLRNAIDHACGEWLTAHTQLIVLLKQRPVT